MKQERTFPLPRPVNQGDPLSAREYNRMRDTLDRIIRTMGGDKNFVPFGTPDPSLIIIPGSTNEKWRIEPGTVNGVTPTIGGTAIDAATPPEITIAADTWVWLKCVGTFGSPDSYVVTVETSTTADTPAGTDISATGFVSFFLVGTIAIPAGGSAYQEENTHTGGDLGVDSWGLYNLWFKV